MKEIRVGILHSLSGTMASSEMHLVDAALFAIDEINRQGGVLGKQLHGVVEDGCSDPEIFKLKAEKLLEQDGVHVVSGCWTSSSRKAVLDNIQDKNVFLLYPVQYEGLEENPNVLYSGSCLNQQISPAIEWCLTQGHEKFYLLGSDYVFPRTANALIRSLVLNRGANILGEDYLPLGSTDFKDVAKSIKFARPDFVISTINGDSNAGFFTQYNKSRNEFPVMSFSIAEHDLRNLGIQSAAHYLCWNYFQNLDNEVNQKFLRDFGKYNEINPITSDPLVMTYSQIRLWSQAVEEARSLDIEAVRAHLHGQRLNSPAGLLEVMPNNHILKYTFIGKQISDKKFEIIWKSDKRIKPEPWLGMEEVELPTAKLVLDALAQYPNLIHLNTSLQTANLELKETKRELEKHREHLEEIVEERTRGLRRSEALFAESQRIGHIGNWELNLVTNVLIWSDEIYRLFGLEPQQFRATYEAFLENIHPDDREMVDQAYTESVRNKTPYNIVHRLLLKDGTIKYVNEGCETFYDGNGKPIRSIGTVQDITERMQAEEELEKHRKHLEELVEERTSDLKARTMELEQANTEVAAINKELEAFAYSVSHDLRAPLRSIDGFSQAVMEEYSDKLDEQGKGYLQRVRSATQRMGVLIDDMLSLSSVTRSEMRRETVDLSALAQSIADELQEAQPERQVDFAITRGLTISGDVRLLHQLLENLLGNAWKYTGNRPQARIEFGTSQIDGKETFSVCDNGVGFDMAYADKLFGVFQRLHSQEEFPGTGVGLATVQRIAYRHGGRVWAEGEVGKGATFYFTFDRTESQ